MVKIITLVSIFLSLFNTTQAQSAISTGQAVSRDTIAERILLFQRQNAGWTQYGGDPADYTKAISSTQKAVLLKDKNKLDATLDDKSTTYEIDYLLKSFNHTKNQTYLQAAENGIRYILAAQYKNGGWPQSYPDTSGYHKYITFNDQAMVNVLTVLQRTARKENQYGPISEKIATEAGKAVTRGISCILKCQYYQNGKLTAWGAQHHNRTLLPAPARKFEPASLSSSESIGIIYFLMSLPQSTPEIKKSVAAAVAWLDQVKLPDIDLQQITDASQASGRDNVVVSKPGNVMWARFYELDTNKPIFVGRDAVIKYSLTQIENERRVGYSWYNNRAAKLISTDYPAWKRKWQIN